MLTCYCLGTSENVVPGCMFYSVIAVAIEEMFMLSQAASSGSRVMILTSQRPSSPAGKLFSVEHNGSKEQTASSTAAVYTSTLATSFMETETGEVEESAPD